jgi:hypothetical protein
MNYAAIVSSIHWGDAPTWVGAIAATFTLIFIGLTLKAQTKQLKIQEESLRDERENNKDEKLKQFVNEFSFWADGTRFNPVIYFINSSVHPINDITIHLTELQTGNRVMVYGFDNVPYGLRYIPNGKYMVTLPSNTFNLDELIEIHFKDAAGNTWSKNSNAEIKLFSRRHRYPDRWLPAPQIAD